MSCRQPYQDWTFFLRERLSTDPESVRSFVRFPSVEPDANLEDALVEAGFAEDLWGNVAIYEPAVGDWITEQ